MKEKDELDGDRLKTREEQVPRVFNNLPSRDDLAKRTREKANNFRNRSDYYELLALWRQKISLELDIDDKKLNILPKDITFELADIIGDIVANARKMASKIYATVVPFKQRATFEVILDELNKVTPNTEIFLQEINMMNFGIITIEKEIALRSILNIINDREDQPVAIFNTGGETGITIEYLIESSGPPDRRRCGYRIFSWGEWAPILQKIVESRCL